MKPRRVVTLGEGLGMLRVPHAGGFELAEAAIIGTGGAEANVAIGLARLGVDVAWLGRVGDDALGRRVRRQLRAEGVHTIAITDHSAPTGLMLKESPRPDRTAVRFYRSGSAGSRLTTADVDLLGVQDAHWLHVTGIPMGLSETMAAAVTRAVEIAQSNGVTVSFDVNHRASLWGYDTAVPVYREIIAQADVVFGGQDELGAVVGHSLKPRDIALAVTALGPAEVVVKCGAIGAGATLDGTWEWRDAIPVVVADTVGAGDAFVAGYIASRLSDSTISSALDLAIRAGAAACEHPGDWEGALRLADLELDSIADPVQR